MANWVCKQDGVQFTPGAPCCPECGTRDAYEQGGDKSLNLYDAVDVTGIPSPGAAWAVVSEAAAIAVHEHRQAWDVAVSADEARAVLMAGDAEVAERLGMVPGDPGAADSSTDPEPVHHPDADGVVEFPADGVERTADLGGETYREPDRSLGLPDDGEPVELEADDDGTGRALPDAVEGDTTEHVAGPVQDTPDTGQGKSRSKARQKDVPS